MRPPWSVAILRRSKARADPVSVDFSCRTSCCIDVGIASASSCAVVSVAAGADAGRANRSGSSATCPSRLILFLVFRGELVPDKAGETRAEPDSLLEVLREPKVDPRLLPAKLAKSSSSAVKNPPSLSLASVLVANDETVLSAPSGRSSGLLRLLSLNRLSSSLSLVLA